MVDALLPGPAALADQLVAELGLRACRFEPFPFDEQLPRIEPGRIELPASEPGVAPWPLDNGVELPVRCNGLTLGRFVLVPEQPTVGLAFPPAARARAITLADRFGQALGRAWAETVPLAH